MKKSKLSKPQLPKVSCDVEFYIDMDQGTRKVIFRPFDHIFNECPFVEKEKKKFWQKLILLGKLIFLKNMMLF